MFNVVRGTLDAGYKSLNLTHLWTRYLLLLTENLIYNCAILTPGKWVELLVFNASRFELHLCDITRSRGVTKVSQHLSESKVNG